MSYENNLLERWEYLNELWDNGMINNDLIVEMEEIEFDLISHYNYRIKNMLVKDYEI